MTTTLFILNDSPLRLRTVLQRLVPGWREWAGVLIFLMGGATACASTWQKTH